jgi:hypothetical protein
LTPCEEIIAQLHPDLVERATDELLGGVYSWAEKRDLVSGPNPVRGVETVRGAAEDRTLSNEELRVLGRPSTRTLRGCQWRRRRFG